MDANVVYVTNPLVAQLRADKNGKLVTRHVADKTASTAPSVALPAPALTTGPEAPEKSDKEVAKEMREALARKLYGDFQTDDDEDYRNALSSLSWFKTSLLENLNDIVDNKPVYQTQLHTQGSLKHLLSSGRGFGVAMEASVHDIATAVHNAGFRDIGSPSQIAEDYFGRSAIMSIKFIRDSHTDDFRIWYLATALQMNEDQWGDGKLSHYRMITSLEANFDDIIKSLPVLSAIINDKENYMIDDGVNDIVAISRHVALHSDDEIARIAEFVTLRHETHVYDPEMVDEMLETPAQPLTNGWL